MRSIFLLIVCHLSLFTFGQVAIKGPWTIAGGASSRNGFVRSSSINLRYISPRFKWSEEYDPEEEKDPEKFKNMRLMAELIYTPTIEVLCAGFNAQYRMIRFKKLCVELYGGPKLFFIPGSDFSIPNSRAGRRGDIWYLNMGLLWQLDLGFILPFVDIGGDKIITVGAEINFRKIYRKPKGRYKLRPIKTK